MRSIQGDIAGLSSEKRSGVLKAAIRDTLAFLGANGQLMFVLPFTNQEPQRNWFISVGFFSLGKGEALAGESQDCGSQWVSGGWCKC